MASETVTAPRPADGLMSSIEDSRVSVGLQAAWEIEELSAALRSNPDKDLLVRGLSLRIGELAGVLMSVLDNSDSGMSTADLQFKVFGRVNDTEVVNG